VRPYKLYRSFCCADFAIPSRYAHLCSAVASSISDNCSTLMAYGCAEYITRKRNSSSLTFSTGRCLPHITIVNKVYAWPHESDWPNNFSASGWCFLGGTISDNSRSLRAITPFLRTTSPCLLTLRPEDLDDCGVFEGAGPSCLLAVGDFGPAAAPAPSLSESLAVTTALWEPRWRRTGGSFNLKMTNNYNNYNN